MSAILAGLGWRGRAELGEGPAWIDDALVWVDLLAGRVHLAARSAPDPIVVHADPGETVSAVLPRRDGGYVVCRSRSVAVLDGSWKVSRVIDLPGVPDGFRLSDAVCGPDGELLVGVVEMAADCSEHPAAGILRLVPGRDPELVLPGVGFANGMAFSPDGAALHVVDSARSTVSTYSYAGADERLGPMVASLPTHEHPGTPDGLAVDYRGGLWIAFFGGSALRHWDGRRWSGVIELATSNPSSCAFIGPRLDELAITTARVELDAEALAAQPDAGSVLIAVPAVPGAVAHRCAL